MPVSLPWGLVLHVDYVPHPHSFLDVEVVEVVVGQPS